MVDIFPSINVNSSNTKLLEYSLLVQLVTCYKSREASEDSRRSTWESPWNQEKRRERERERERKKETWCGITLEQKKCNEYPGHTGHQLWGGFKYTHSVYILCIRVDANSVSSFAWNSLAYIKSFTSSGTLLYINTQVTFPVYWWEKEKKGMVKWEMSERWTKRKVTLMLCVWKESDSWINWCSPWSKKWVVYSLFLHLCVSLVTALCHQLQN